MKIFEITVPPLVVTFIARLALLGRGFKPEESLAEQLADIAYARGEQQDILVRFDRCIRDGRYDDHLRMLQGAVAVASDSPPRAFDRNMQRDEQLQRVGAIAYMAMENVLEARLAKHGIREGVGVHGWKKEARKMEQEENSRQCAECDDGRVHYSSEGEICKDCMCSEEQLEACCDRCYGLGLGTVHAQVTRDSGTAEHYLCGECAADFPHYPYCPTCAGADEAPAEHSWGDSVSDNPSHIPASVFA